MSDIRIINGHPLPNMPWQDRPAQDTAATPLWRYSENPVMGRNPTPEIGRIFNSAVVPWQDGYIAVLRGEQVDGVPHVYLGRSKDGIHWQVDREKVKFVDEQGNPWMPNYAYDPRLVRIDDTYYIIWCTDFSGAAIGMARTKDFEHFIRMENPFIPYNRNAVLFPRKIGGMYKLLSRPSDSAHTPFGDISLRKPRLDLLGPSPSCDEPWTHVVGGGEDRRRRVPHRDHRGLADAVPWRGQHLQRLCVFHGRRDSGY